MTKRKLHVCDSLPLPKRVSIHHSPKVCTAVRTSAWAYAAIALVGYFFSNKPFFSNRTEDPLKFMAELFRQLYEKSFTCTVDASSYFYGSCNNLINSVVL